MAPKAVSEKKPAQPAKKAVAKKSTGGKKKGGSKKAVESYKIYIYKVGAHTRPVPSACYVQAHLPHYPAKHSMCLT